MGNNLFDLPDDGVLRVGADDYDVINAYSQEKLFDEVMREAPNSLTKAVKAMTVKNFFYVFGKTSIAIANASLESIRQDSLKKYGRRKGG